MLGFRLQNYKTKCKGQCPTPIFHQHFYIYCVHSMKIVENSYLCRLKIESENEQVHFCYIIVFLHDKFLLCAAEALSDYHQME